MVGAVAVVKAMAIVLVALSTRVMAGLEILTI